MTTTTIPTVPVADNGLEGWTSCCAAAVTYSGVTLCCKACWSAVDMVMLYDHEGIALSEIVSAVIHGTMSAADGVAAQQRLLKQLALSDYSNAVESYHERLAEAGASAFMLYGNASDANRVASFEIRKPRPEDFGLTAEDLAPAPRPVEPVDPTDLPF